MVDVSRTDVDLDDELVAEVMNRYGLTTKKDAVDLALRRLAVVPMTPDEVIATAGRGWDGDLGAMRDGDQERSAQLRGRA